ncbi:MAG: FAD binding domain-containing protein [Pyrinomonadaceae bacterium]
MWVFSAKTTDEAVARMAEGCIALAGGTVLVPKIVRGEYERTTFVDIRRLSGLKEITTSENGIQIGSAVTLNHLVARLKLPEFDRALTEAAAAVGNPHVRNIATIAGNLTSGLAGADLPTALLALGAEITHQGSDGEQSHPVAETMQRGLASGRLITSIRLPRNSQQVSGFAKFAWRRSSGKTIVNVAMALSLRDGRINAATLAVGGTGPHAVRLPQAESMLSHQALTRKLAEEVAATAANEVTFTTAHSTREHYRRRLVAAGVREIMTKLGAS